MFTLTPYVLRNLTSKKATRQYPKQKRSAFEAARGELSNRIEQCTFCGVCALKCPSQCISVDKKDAVWSCDPSSCVFCGICVDACPSKSLYQKTEYRIPFQSPRIISLKGELKKRTRNE